MIGSQEIRKKLGLTQHELAGLLEVSRSSINLYELGRRSLPAAALLKLGQLEIMYNLPPQEGAPAVLQNRSAAGEEHSKKQIALLQGKIKACRVNAAGLQQQLQDMQLSFNRLICLLRTIDTWQQNSTDPGSIIKSKLHLEIMQYKLLKKMRLAGMEEQFILQHEIDLQLTMAAAYESALDQLKTGTFNNNR